MKILNQCHGQLTMFIDTSSDAAGVLVIQDIDISEAPSQALILRPNADPIGFQSSAYGPEVTVAMAVASVNDLRTGLSALAAGAVVGPAASVADAASANGPAPSFLTEAFNNGNNLGRF